MIEISFLMPNGEQPHFNADLTVGQLAETTLSPIPFPGGRNHLYLEYFESSRLRVIDALQNPIILRAIEDPGAVYLEMSVSNLAGGILQVLVAGADTLTLQPGQQATVTYNRNASMKVRSV
jgi:hypothetical protein